MNNKIYNKKKINITIGRFQPFTKGHLNMIKEGSNVNGKFVPCIIYQIKSKDIPDNLKGWKVGSRVVKKTEIENILKYVKETENVNLSEHEKDILKRPFSNELVRKELEIVKQNNKNLIFDIVYVTNMFEALIHFNNFIREHQDEYEPNYLLCGDDRVDSYEKTINQYDEIETEFRSGNKTKNLLKGTLKTFIGNGRTDGVSGTDVRNAIINNDKAKFSQLMPAGVGNTMWDDFKETFDNFINKLNEMINENKLDNLVNYINEALSDAHIKKLEQYINDDDFDIYFKGIKEIHNHSRFIDLKHPDKRKNNYDTDKLTKNNNSLLDKYLSYHGLTTDYFNSGATDIKEFIINTFVKNNGSNLLETIISNNGLIYFNKIDVWKKYNFNKLIESSLKNYKNKGNISNTEINNIINSIFNYNTPQSNNSAVGKGEILLKFILKSKNKKSKHGDICLYNDNNTTFENIEVKSSEKPTTGARVCGLIKTNKDVSDYFVKLYGEDKTSKIILFGNKKDLNDRIMNFFDGHIKDVDLFIENVVKSIAYQYTAIDNPNEPITDSLIKTLIKVSKQWNNSNKCVQSTIIDINMYIQFIGALQTYMYYVQDAFTKLIVINNENKNFVICDFGNFTIELLDKMIKTFVYNPGEATGDIKNTRRSASRIFIE